MRFRYPEAKLTIGWDNASWHRGEAGFPMFTYVNMGLAPEDWQMTLITVATNDPAQNPIEEGERQAKTRPARTAA